MANIAVKNTPLSILALAPPTPLCDDAVAVCTLPRGIIEVRHKGEVLEVADRIVDSHLCRLTVQPHGSTGLLIRLEERIDASEQ
jgi:hypothetical protein